MPDRVHARSGTLPPTIELHHMEHDRVPTVRIVAPISVGNPHGYIVINEAD
jgi:hypothetical protein